MLLLAEELIKSKKNTLAGSVPQRNKRVGYRHTKPCRPVSTPALKMTDNVTIKRKIDVVFILVSPVILLTTNILLNLRFCE